MAVPAPPFSSPSRSRKGAPLRPPPRRAVANRAAALIGAWVRRRQGNDPSAFVLRRRRIYILPTRYGTAFGCVLFAMLLGSINYAASLGFALTFLLAGLALAMLHQCHANLLGLEIAFAGASPAFAGGAARFKIRLTNTSRTPRYEIGIAAAGQRFGPVDVPPGRSVILEFSVPAARRGRLVAPRFAIETGHPGSLFRAWTYVHMEIAALVYPAPAPPGEPPPIAYDEHDGRQVSDHAETDFAGLRNAVPGDPPRRIAWKAFARTDDLLLKQFEGGTAEVESFDYAAVPRRDPEERLSLLARWCLDASTAGKSFGLRMPNATVPVGAGERHLHRCLAALALFPALATEAER